MLVGSVLSCALLLWFEIFSADLGCSVLACYQLGCSELFYSLGYWAGLCMWAHGWGRMWVSRQGSGKVCVCFFPLAGALILGISYTEDLLHVPYECS